jgi:hypothetical protein
MTPPLPGTSAATSRERSVALSRDRRPRRVLALSLASGQGPVCADGRWAVRAAPCTSGGRSIGPPTACSTLRTVRAPGTRSLDTRRVHRRLLLFARSRRFSSATTDAGIGRHPHRCVCFTCQLTRCSSVALFGIGCRSCHAAFNLDTISAPKSALDSTTPHQCTCSIGFRARQGNAAGR